MTDDVFSSTESETETTDVFEGTSSDTSDKKYLEELVGEGRKFKDIESLARGKLESDKFIESLQRELKELREDLGKQEYSKELLNELRNKATEATTVNTSSKGDDNTKSQTLSSEDVEALVSKHLKDEEVRRTANQNIQKASDEVTKLYKEKTKEVLVKRSQELGMSLERMKEIAAESPTAFLRLVGDVKATTPDSIPESKVNTTNFNNQTDERDWGWWQKLRRESKTKYHSPEMTKLRLKDIERLGDRFGLPK